MKSSKTVFLKRIIFFRSHKEEIDFYSVLKTVFILQKLNKHSISIETSHVIPYHQIVGRGSTSCPSQWGEGSCCDVWWHWAHFIVLTNHNWTKLWTDNSCSHSRTEHSEDTGLQTLLDFRKGTSENKFLLQNVMVEIAQLHRRKRFFRSILLSASLFSNIKQWGTLTLLLFSHSSFLSSWPYFVQP